jgi:glycosyltransferase involved in cell wall biosynthesis
MESLRFLLTSSFYPPYHVGGDANHVRYLAEELARLGNEVHVVHSLDAYRVKRKEFPKRCGSRGVVLHKIETRFSRSAYEAYVFGASHRITNNFRAIVREVKPDIVHHHNISLLGYEILERYGNYVNLCTAHDYWLICPQSNLLRNGRQVCDKGSCVFCGLFFRRPPQFWRYGSRFKRAIGQIDMLIAPSDYLRDRITREVPVRAVTIPNFVPNPPAQMSSSSRFGKFLIYAGMLEKHKGVLELLKAYKELAKNADVKLVIVGDGTLRHRLREAVVQNGLMGMVHLMGWVEHDSLYPMLKESAALVIPSIAPENAPLIALEALSMGTPVVGSDIGGLPEIVDKVDSRLTFSWCDPDGLRRALDYAIEHKSTLTEIAKDVFNHFYTPEKYLDRYVTLLNRDS